MWRKRGRPKSCKNSSAIFGNVSAKKKIIVSLEPLDVYFKNKIISEDEHQSGMRLRWLYTLRYGAPTLQTKLLQQQGFESKYNDEEWLMKKQQQYRFIIGELQKSDLAKIVLGVCVFNEAVNKFNQLKFCYGMQILQKTFQRKYKFG
jgi:hypothetical protein